jgi:hypothetical protein
MPLSDAVAPSSQTLRRQMSKVRPSEAIVIAEQRSGVDLPRTF